MSRNGIDQRGNDFITKKRLAKRFWVEVMLNYIWFDIIQSVNYEIIYNMNVNPIAQQLHGEARELGQAGNYDAAIVKLQEAIQMQPDWPYPSYDLAFTYLLKGDFDNALAFYQKTDELAPEGFFTAKTALYTLQGEKTGRFPTGLYAKYMTLEWVSDENEKLAIVKSLLSVVPDYAPAWKEMAVLLENIEEKENAIEQGLSNDPDADTKGILLINKAIVLYIKGRKEEAAQLLSELIDSPATTTGNIEMARYTLNSITA